MVSGNDAAVQKNKQTNYVSDDEDNSEDEEEEEEECPECGIVFTDLSELASHYFNFHKEKKTDGASSEEKKPAGASSEEKKPASASSEEKKPDGASSEEKKPDGASFKENKPEGGSSEKLKPGGAPFEEMKSGGAHSEEINTVGAPSEEIKPSPGPPPATPVVSSSTPASIPVRKYQVQSIQNRASQPIPVIKEEKLHIPSEPSLASSAPKHKPYSYVAQRIAASPQPNKPSEMPSNTSVLTAKPGPPPQVDKPSSSVNTAKLPTFSQGGKPLVSAQTAKPHISAQTAKTPSSAQTAKTPSSAQTAKTPSSAQTAKTSSSAQTAKASSSVLTAKTPSSSQAAKTPSSAQTVKPPLSAQTVKTPSSAQTAKTPSSAQKPKTPSSSQAAKTPSSVQTVKPPSSAQTPKTPSSAQKPKTPSFELSAKTPSSAQIPKTPSSAQTVKTPSSAQIPKTPSSAQTPKTSSFELSAKPPSSAQTPKTPSSAKTRNKPSPEQSAATPSSSQSAKAPSSVQSAKTPSYAVPKTESKAVHKTESKAVHKTESKEVPKTESKAVPVQTRRSARTMISPSKQSPIQPSQPSPISAKPSHIPTEISTNKSSKPIKNFTKPSTSPNKSSPSPMPKTKNMKETTQPSTNSKTQNSGMEMIIKNMFGSNENDDVMIIENQQFNEVEKLARNHDKQQNEVLEKEVKEDTFDDPEDTSVPLSEDLGTYENMLARYIQENDLPFIPRFRNRSDGNCWYEAIADQIDLHDIPNTPRDHVGLRKVICDALLTLPQSNSWIKNLFGGKKKRFLNFVEKHRKDGEWTDSKGLVCQATALMLKRKIHIVGTANMNQSVCYTKLESVPEAEQFKPLIVGYYQDKHYQSLESIEMDFTSEPEPVQANKNNDQIETCNTNENVSNSEDLEICMEVDELKHNEEMIQVETDEVKPIQDPVKSVPQQSAVNRDDQMTHDETPKTGGEIKNIKPQGKIARDPIREKPLRRKSSGKMVRAPIASHVPRRSIGNREEDTEETREMKSEANYKKKVIEKELNNQREVEDKSSVQSSTDVPVLNVDVAPTSLKSFPISEKLLNEAAKITELLNKAAKLTDAKKKSADQTIIENEKKKTRAKDREALNVEKNRALEASSPEVNGVTENEFFENDKNEPFKSKLRKRVESEKTKPDESETSQDRLKSLKKGRGRPRKNLLNPSESLNVPTELETSRTSKSRPFPTKLETPQNSDNLSVATKHETFQNSENLLIPETPKNSGRLPVPTKQEIPTNSGYIPVPTKRDTPKGSENLSVSTNQETHKNSVNLPVPTKLETHKNSVNLPVPTKLGTPKGYENLPVSTKLETSKESKNLPVPTKLETPKGSENLPVPTKQETPKESKNLPVPTKQETSKDSVPTKLGTTNFKISRITDSTRKNVITENKENLSVAPDNLNNNILKTDKSTKSKSTRKPQLSTAARRKQLNSAATKIQIWYKHAYKGHAERRNFLRKRDAAIKIQSYWRFFISRKNVIKTKAAVVLQNKFRSFQVRKHFLKKRKAASLIQKVFRTTKSGKVERKDFLRKKKAAIVIQTRWRRCLSLLNGPMFQLIPPDEEYINPETGELQLMDDYVINPKTGEMEKIPVELPQYLNRISGFLDFTALSNMAVKSWKKSKMKLDMLEKIQGQEPLYKMSKAKSYHVDDVKDTDQDGELIYQNIFSIRLRAPKTWSSEGSGGKWEQIERRKESFDGVLGEISHWKRPFNSVDRLSEPSVSENNTYDSFEDSNYEESVFKGLKESPDSPNDFSDMISTKKIHLHANHDYLKFGSLRSDGLESEETSWLENRIEMRRQSLRNRSALTIQSYWRAYIPKKNFLKSRYSVIKIQRWFRKIKEKISSREVANVEKQTFLKMKSAAKILQYQWRSWLSARKARRSYLSLKTAALTMQSHWRGLLGRRRASILKAKREAAKNSLLLFSTFHEDSSSDDETSSLKRKAETSNESPLKKRVKGNEVREEEETVNRKDSDDEASNKSLRRSSRRKMTRS